MKAKNSNETSHRASNNPKVFVFLFVALIGAGVRSSAWASVLSHAPLIGAVTDTSAKIWVRSDAPASALVQYQLAGGNWSQPLQSAAVSLVAANDFTATFSLNGLAPSTSYDYRITLDGVVQPSSTSVVKTVPASGAGARFSFIFGADIHPGAAPHTPFSIMAVEQPDFALLLGDQIYHLVDSGSESEFWTLYKANRDIHFQNFAKSTPIFTLWDDGDYGQDGGDSSYTWRSLARAAFGKYWANPPFVEASGAIYYKFSVADVDFFMLDSRWGRISGVTLLGAAQLQWLKSQLLASTAKFKFIVSPVMVSDFGTTGTDSWKGYGAERANLFQHIAANNIKNVIFLSGDQHWAGAFLINYPVFQVGHGIQGFYEVSPTPLSAFKLGAPQSSDPQMLFGRGQDNHYGLVRVDTTIVPRRVEIEIHSGSNGAMVYSLPIEEFTPTPAPAITTVSLPQGTLNIPYSQALTATDGISPYQWQVTNGALPPGMNLSSNGILSGTPTQAATFFFTVRVQDSVSASSSRTLSLTINSDTVASSLLNQNFSGILNVWTIVDEGTLEGPSKWVVGNGQLIQQSNIYGGATSASDPVKPGTFAYAGNPSWNNYEFNASLLSQDDDALGVMFRYQNRQNYYRFAMDKERFYRRLTKTVNGVTTVLAQDSVPYDKSRWYAVKVRANGNAIQVYLDGVLLFNVTDNSIGTGMVGLYSWGNSGSYFDDVTVITLAAQAPPLPTIITSSLPNGIVNAAYNQSLVASGGAPPYAWSVASGALPPGVTLSQAGIISGTPTTAGTSSFVVQVRDSVLAGVTQSLALTITAPGATLTAAPVNLAPGTTVTASWSGITAPTARDWIGLYAAGAADTSYLSWSYISCSQTASSSAPSGSCPLALPSTLAFGNYELRIFANNVYTRLATSNSFAVSSLPVVTVAATVANSAEGGGLGQFTVTRTGSSATSLAVSYSIGGTAINGTDYAALTGSVVISAASATATIAVLPADDSSVENSETVVLTLSPNANYLVGVPNTATISITDNDFIPTVSITGGTFTFDGTAHGATGFAYGVGGTSDVLSPPVTFNYQGTGSTVYGPSPIAPTNAGTYLATASFAGNANYLSASGSATVAIHAIAATLTLSNLAQVFDGNPKPATVTTNPPALAGVAITYNGNSTAPTNAGTYTVVATLTNSNYTAPNATGSLVIGRAGSTTTVSVTNVSYDGLLHGGAAGVVGVGGLIQALAVTYSATGGTVYPASTTAPTGAGTYSASAIFAGDSNHNGSSDSKNFSIGKANPTLSVTGSTFSFDGNPHGAAGFTYGAGGAGDVLSPGLVFTYQGTGGTTYGPTSTAPTNIGTYIANANFAGNNNYNSASSAVAVTINPVGPAITAAPTVTTPGSSVTANWIGIGSPTARDWIGLYASGAADTSYLAWVYLSCTQSAGTGSASGSCPFGIPSALATGTYELRLFTNNEFTRLATSNSFAVAPATPSLVIVLSTLAAGTGGAAYSQTLTATGGISPYTWSITSGALPAGLNLSASGTISGTPTVAGTSTFSVQVRDTALGVATQSLNLTINPASTNPTISLSYDGLLRDRVGQAEFALTPDGTLDGAFTVILNAGSGNRTVTRLYLTTSGGIWDTQAPDGYWSLGAASALDSALLNGANDAVNFPLTEGSSLKIFAADYQNLMFVNGMVFTLVANFADGSTATASTTITASPETLPGFSDNFSGTLSNWTIVDEGTFEGPSSWVISNGEIVQRSNIWGGNSTGSDPVKPGTFAIAGNALWQDYDFSLRLMSEDDDSLGAMFRYADNLNYYRFSMDKDRAYRRLVKVVNGVTTILAQDNVPYVTGQAYDLRTSLTGSHIQIYLNQALIFDVLDASLPRGKIALYSWGNANSHFDDIVVTAR